MLISGASIAFLPGSVLAQMAPADAASARASAPRSEDIGIQDIVVTASKTGESAAQRTPIAISAFNSESLKDAGISNVKDLAGYVPNLSINQSTTYALIYVRGIGSTNIYGGSDPSVTVQVDGVYLGRPYSQFADFLDVDRVEVLRGPQGTLYGRNAAGGTINIISKTPTDSFGFENVLQVGNYSSVQEQAYVSGPLIPNKLQFSLAGSYYHHKPYIKNIIPTGNDIFNANRGGLRSQLRWELSDDIVATTRADFSQQKEHTTSFSLLRLPFTPATTSILGDFSRVALNLPNNDNVRIWGISEDIRVRLNDNLDLRSITAYRNSRNKVDVDSDDSDVSITQVHQGEAQHQLSSELNLAGNFDRFNFVTGLYYMYERVATDIRVTVFPANFQLLFRPVNKSTSYAAYVQGTYKIKENLSLTAGGRYSFEKKAMDQLFLQNALSTGANLATVSYHKSRSFKSFTPKLSLQWTPTANLLGYASITRGFKSGGFNFSSTNPATASFRPEKLWSYELGVKTDWFDRHLRVNLTGFIYDYTDLQQFLATAPGVAVIANAATARVKGIELEVKARPWSGLDLGANLAYLHARYTKYLAAPIPQTLGQGSLDVSGFELNNAPPYSISVFGQQSVPVSDDKSVYVRGEYLWMDRQYNEPTNYILQRTPAYGLVNVTAGLRNNGGSWAIELWCRNLTDKKYLIGTQDSGATFSAQPGAPRTFGVELKVKFGS
jgi:iron complex outermembrane receptor protein